MTVKASGYLTTAQSVAWTGGDAEDRFTTDNEWTDLSDEIDNTSNLYAYMQLDLVLGSAAFTGSGRWH